ncbi:hypothetical protein SAMN05421881_11292 [Nitrosomonas halophila]|uniref:Uncharacterized protein n=1 Tax=Nitrosomonas halophila TaxID=44576 RepID=A0A1H3Q2T4_9PROT|nr:hypothetical protein SAMN05421881_11292 [Nitrosomonas halophila]
MARNGMPSLDQWQMKSISEWLDGVTSILLTMLWVKSTHTISFPPKKVIKLVAVAHGE